MHLQHRRSTVFLLWSLTALWNGNDITQVVAQDIDGETTSSTMHPSQTPSSTISRITAASLFTSNGNVSVTSSPSLPPIPLTVMPAINDNNLVIAPSTASLMPPTFRPSSAPTTSTPNEQSVDQNDVMEFDTVQTRLPQITIDVEVSNQLDLVSSKDEKLMNDFWQGFVDNLLMASDLIPSSLFQSTTLEVSIEPAAIRTANATVNATISFVVAMNGTAHFLMDEPPERETLRHTMYQSLIAYLSFWGTHEMEQSLEKRYALEKANVTSIFLDGTIVRIEDESHGYGKVEWTEEASGTVPSSGQQWMPFLVTISSCTSMMLL